MGKHRKWIQITILLAVLIIGGWTIAGSLIEDNGKSIPRVGDKAPDFKLADLDGKIHSLSDYKGQAVVLNFWGTYCPPCRDEMPDMEKQHQKWSQSPVTMIGVNMGESAITVQNFIREVEVTFPIFLDNKEEIRKRYGVIYYPSTVFIGADGVIKQITVGGPMTEAFIEQSIMGLLGS